MNLLQFRQINRLHMHLPVRVTMSQAHQDGISDPEVYTVTENISSGGCYFFLAQEPPVGTRLELEITIPGEVPDIPFAKICCRGKVVRVDCRTDDAQPRLPKFGVAARIVRLPDVSIESIPRPAEYVAGTIIA